MNIGYDQPLYILPFDHRSSFEKTLFGWKGPLTPEQTDRIAASKRVIYEQWRSRSVVSRFLEFLAIPVRSQM